MSTPPRGTYITNLSRGGASLCQKLARHSDPKLTTKLEPDDLDGAAQRMAAVQNLAAAGPPRTAP